MCFIDLSKAFLVNALDAHWVGSHTTVEAEGCIVCGVGKGTTRSRRLREDGNWVVECARWAVGSGSREEGGGGWELDLGWGLWGVGICRGVGLHVYGLVDWGWHGGLKDRRVNCRSSAGGDGASSLAAVASVGQLVVVKATSQLGLFQVSGNVLVWHLLEAGLKKINFL